MKNLRMWIAAALSALGGAGMAVIVGSAGAEVPSGNVISNPGAETGGVGTSPSSGPAPPDWERLFQNTTQIEPGGDFEQVGYGFSSFPDTALSTAIGGGSGLFAGGTRFFFGPSFARQTVSLAGAAPEIDAGRLTATLAAYLGGEGASTDEMRVDSEFRGADGATLSTLTVGPVTPAERGNATTLLPRTASAAVPRGARSAVVTMRAFAPVNDGYIDAYADNVSLTFRATPLPGPTPTVPPANPPAGLAAPKLDETFAVMPVSGQVFVSTPPGSAARAAASVPGIKGRSFVPLVRARNIPIGSLLDTRRGRVRLATARDSSGKLQAADFRSGVFQVLQSKKKSANGLTEARLKGASFKPCARGKSSSAAAALTAEAARGAPAAGSAACGGALAGGAFGPAAATPRRRCGVRTGR